MSTRIEKIGNTGWALRCTIHGLIANENDLSLIEDMQRRHDEYCAKAQSSAH